MKLILACRHEALDGERAEFVDGDGFHMLVDLGAAPLPVADLLTVVVCPSGCGQQKVVGVQ